jgi:hypothetical protein
MLSLSPRAALAPLALLAALLYAFSLISCGNGASDAGWNESIMAEAADMNAPAAPSRSMAKLAGGSSSEASLDASPGAAGSATAAPSVAGRKLVYDASMSVEAKDPALVEAAVLKALAAAGGYASSRNVDEYATYLQLRVPVPALEDLMDLLAGQARTLARSLSAQDVTDQYFDLEGRLRNKRLLEERYREYLKRSASLEDILAVERSLSDTTTEIEWLEGSFRDLSRRIELATLNITIRPLRALDPSRPSLGKALSDLFAGVGDVARIAVVALVGVIVYGVPALLLAAFLWWLSFGKLGLLRKLFALAARVTKDKAGKERA